MSCDNLKTSVTTFTEIRSVLYGESLNGDWIHQNSESVAQIVLVT